MTGTEARISPVDKLPCNFLHLIWHSLASVEQCAWVHIAGGDWDSSTERA